MKASRLCLFDQLERPDNLQPSRGRTGNRA